MRRNSLFTLAALLTFIVTAADAQVATGTITGRTIDPTGEALAGVVVRATSPETGFTRELVSDSTGVYRLAGLPAATYRLHAEVAGFRPFEQPNVIVNVGSSVSIDITLFVVVGDVDVVVEATTPLVSTRSSAVGEVVDVTRVEGLPLNGRQFANLAGLVPGVGLGFHSDPTKSAQYTPQVSGGNGRNINYLVDGGDNNDDTVGGLLQMFPLEAVQEFNVATQRYSAEYGRSNGAVLNVVTKSGTNTPHASWFTLVRDNAMNARTVSETAATIPKQDYQRYQYGGSFGGPIIKDRAHYFVAYEGTQQNTKQAVNTQGLYQDGVYDVHLRQHLLTGKVTAQPAPGHSLAVRYAYDHDTQPNGAAPNAAFSTWTTSTNNFGSLNASHNWVIGGRALNAAVVQYARFTNDIPLGSSEPALVFPNGVFGGSSLSAPQRTEQVKWQFRDDYSWTTGGFGLWHEVRAGASWIHEPRLYAANGQGVNGIFVLVNNSLTSPVLQVLASDGKTSADIPIDFYGGYVQDDWRVTNRLVLNLGVRYDLVDGMPIDQRFNANFTAMQAAGRAGRFAGTVLEDFGQEPRNDRNNIQPRLGAAYDPRGDGKDVIRGGWGIYTDFGYTNANALTAALQNGGLTFTAFAPTGLVKPDGTFFRVTDPLSSIAALNGIDPNAPRTNAEVVSPLLQQPLTYQTNIGWSHELNPSTALRADYVKVQGRDLNVRIRTNALVNGSRLLSGVGVQPNDFTFRTAVSQGRSEYDALIVGFRRRMSRGVDVSAGYTLARALSDLGTAYDELASNLIQDVTQPFSATQLAPSARTDSRHQITASAIVQAPWGISIAPVLMYRSALPVHTFQGTDLNGDGNINDSTLQAYRYTGLDASGRATYEEDGPCRTVNCSRRAAFAQMNLRASKGFRVGNTKIEAIAEIFNLFNAKNPSLAVTQRLLIGGQPNPTFMQPNAYAGDVGQPEQRVGQLGFRFSF